MSAPTDEQLRQSLTRYQSSLATRAAASKPSAELVQLDHWYRTELRATLQERKQEGTGAFLTTEELVKLMQWKLAVSSSHAYLLTSATQ